MAETLRVVVATGLYPPEIGGPATHTVELERELPRHDFSLAVVPFSSVRRFPPLIRHLIYLAKLLRASKGAAIIYALDPVSVGFPALLASWIAGKRFILRVAGDYAWEQGTQRFGVTAPLDTFVSHVHEQPRMVRILAAIEAYVARHAETVITPSEYLKRIVCVWGIDPSRITVVYNAVEHVTAATVREEYRRQHGYEGMVLMSAARLVPWKGFETLIDAVAQLQKEGRVVTCLIAGNGPEEQSLREQAAKKGVAHIVRFLGRLDKAELMNAVAASDIFVLNTGYEGFSHQLLEVMSLGIPTVTTPVGGNVELIREGAEGLFVPYNDKDALRIAIAKLCDDPELRARLGSGARARVGTFTVVRMIEGVVGVLRGRSK